MIGRHVEGPLETVDAEAGRRHGHHETADARRVARLAARARKHERMRRGVHARLPHLLPADPPSRLVAVHGARGRGGHVRCVAPVFRLRQAKGDADVTREHPSDEFVALALLRPQAIRSRATPIPDHGDEWEIAHDRVLSLQVIEQPQPSSRKMHANRCHP